MPARSSSRRLAALSAHLVSDEAVPDSDEVLYAVDGPIAIITLNVSSPSPAALHCALRPC